jgi:hypothetical protein
MKKLSIIALALISYSVQAQRLGHEFGLNYVYACPVGSMGLIIRNGQGATVNYGIVMPNRQFVFGVEIASVQYGIDRSRQQYTMSDGTTAPMDVSVTNYFQNVMTYSRWYPSASGHLRPYLLGKLGYTWFETDLNITDPNAYDQCTPLQHDILHKSGTVVITLGAGLKYDLSSIFKTFRENKFFLETSVNFTQGGQVTYMNQEADTNHPHSNTPDSDHVMANFVNTQTQVVHQHHVGHLYRSPVEMVNVQAGFSMRIAQ